jgi:iron complex outermembrane recepter protein
VDKICPDIASKSNPHKLPYNSQKTGLNQQKGPKMIRSFATTLRATTMLASAMTLMAIPEMAVAQAAEDEASATSGEIIVNARKRGEDIQTVPLSITAYTSEDLAERNISNLQDLGNATPGLAITSITGGTLVGIYVRGLAPANTANDLNVDANVGVFIDGMYQTSRNTLDIISVLDVGQIEVVKGPQSALYGRSTFAGAMNISTKRPSREFEGSVTATAGTDEDLRLRGTIGGPLGEDLSFRVAGGYLSFDGTGRNIAAPKDNLGGTKKYAFSAALEVHPSDRFNLLFSGFITRSSTELSPTTLLPFSAFNCGNASVAALTLGKGQLYCGPQPVSRLSSISTDIPDTKARNQQLTMDMNVDLGFGDFISATGFTRSSNRVQNDFDGTAGGTLLGVCTVPAACFGGVYSRLTSVNAVSLSLEKVKTFSQEFRIQSKDESDFSWLFGFSAFYSRVPLAASGLGATASTPLAATERLIALTQIATPPAAGVGAFEFTANPFYVANAALAPNSSSYSDSRTKSRSLFGALGYRFGGLRVTAEGRYNVDRKRAQIFTVNANPTAAPGVNQVIVGTTTPAGTTFPNAGPVYYRQFSSFAPRLTVDWQANEDILLYATGGKGVRNGGFNTANPANGAANGILASEAAYDEETNWTYEAGIKSRFFDRRLTFNASVFHVDWKNAQVSGFTQNPAATVVSRIVQNIGGIKTTGIEFSADAKLSDMFSFGGNFSYSDPKFAADVYDGGQIGQCVVGTGAAATAAPGCPPVIVVTRANGTSAAVPSIAGQRPQRSVKTQWNLHAKVAVPISDDWKASARVDVNYTGPAFNNLINTQSFGKRTLTNVRIGFDSDKYSISLWGNNIFNKAYVQNSINQPRIGLPFAFVVPEIYLGEERRMGITASAKF